MSINFKGISFENIHVMDTDSDSIKVLSEYLNNTK